jgi:colicin import membrane protein
MTALRRHINELDMPAWASMTKRTAQRAVAAAEQAGRKAPPRLLAIAAMSETELIEARRQSMWAPTRKAPTLKQLLLESQVSRSLAVQQAESAEHDARDSRAEVRAARAEAEHAASNADDARNRARLATEELLRKELQYAAERRETASAIELLRDQLAQAQALATGARKDAQESAAAAKAAREREAAALDKYARQGAQLAGAQRKVETALQKSQASEEKMRAELDQVRSDTSAALAAAIERASAAEQRSEERLAERAADRRTAQITEERLQSELVKVRSNAETEIAAALERAKAAENRALQRMSERTADRAAAQGTIAQLQAHLERARANAIDEIQTAREQAALTLSKEKERLDRQLAQVRSVAQRQVNEATDARDRAENALGRQREERRKARTPSGGVLSIPVPAQALRPAAKRIENTLTALHQIDYILEVGMAEQIAAEIPLDVKLVDFLTRSVLEQAEHLIDEFTGLPSRFSVEADAMAAAEYVEAAVASCQDFLSRISSASASLANRRGEHEVEALGAVRRMLSDPRVRGLFPERSSDSPRV